MSLDSRLLRPRRSNKSSASSALVRVGVTSVGCRARPGGLAGPAMTSVLRLLLTQARAGPLCERSDDGSDDALDLFIGERAAVVTQLEANREAALAGSDSRRAARLLAG